MRSSTRIRLARFLTACALAWPAVQHGLTRSFDMHPWHFMGFAMYATPRPPLQGREAMLAGGDGELKALPLERLPEPAQRAVLEILARSVAGRSAYGELYDARPEAAALLALSPSAQRVVLSIERCALDERAFVACETLQYACERGAECPREPRR